MINKIKNIAVFYVFFVSTSLLGQIGIGAGASTLLEFGNSKPFVGLNLNLEFPRNNEVTFYTRMLYHFKQTNYFDYMNTNAIPINPNGAYISVPVQADYTMNYFMIDGGTRYYLINGFDEGFSLYGGTNIGLIVNSVSYYNNFRLGEYDANNFIIDQSYIPYLPKKDKASLIRLALGFTGGMKYTIPGVGSFYFDINPHLSMFGIPSKDGIPRDVYKQVFFNFNIGYRKEIYW